jgi:hypothetical protein
VIILKMGIEMRTKWRVGVDTLGASFSIFLQSLLLFSLVTSVS